ncbi:type III pantothenate kinase [Lewinella aquimaris]|uniref:Type III pantothenate kinase n=1 Tax=Neolewinella aquimaris TaxID=1835722 RepID=A0A840E827_9BACT|nr:type III pantothenate kinase [Neolewinella aquimaris]MBB4079447.1 type III pantothenate kinase [Neolewinella aquimaris]
MSSPSRNLVVDVGNSGTKAAAFTDGEMMLPVARVKSGDWSAIDGMVTNLGVQNIIYSTVANVPSQRWTDKWKKAGLGVYSLDRTLPLPFQSDYQTMDTLGQDRIAVVAGTVGRMHTARLIVDAGSCVTSDLVDRNDRYLGGNISPGVTMRLRSMHEHTARLPLIETGTATDLVGRSTGQALLHGGQLGVVYEIEGLFGRLLTVHRDLQLVLTGGDAPLLLPYFSIDVLSYPNLVLLGLNQILSTYVNKHV